VSDFGFWILDFGFEPNQSKIQNPKSKMEHRAVVTGASSGIGLAVSRELARRGYKVAMLARRVDLLEKEAASVPGAVAVPCDVCDAAAVTWAVRQGESKLGGPFDLAVANAGIGKSGHAAKFDLETAERTIRTNVLGMMYLFGAVIPSMVERRGGRFAGVASLAGLRGMPTSAAYSASKAAMQAFLESSRVELAPYGVKVTTINPGFIATAMTEKNKFRMPLLMQVEETAPIIVDGIERGARVVEFPLPMSILTRLARLVPDALWDRMIAPAARLKKMTP
jgi:short-subunit dehydrogenase